MESLLPLLIVIGCIIGGVALLYVLGYIAALIVFAVIGKRAARRLSL